MECSLEKQKCIPCSGEVRPLNLEEIVPLLAQLEGWECVEYRSLEKSFHFKNFQEPLQLLNGIAFLAEKLGHHPNMELRWGSLCVRIYTHKINGLHLNDFILAKKIDQLIESAR